MAGISAASKQPSETTPPTAEQLKEWEAEKVAQVESLDKKFLQQIKNKLQQYQAKSTAKLGKDLAAVLQLHRWVLITNPDTYAF